MSLKNWFGDHYRGLKYWCDDRFGYDHYSARFLLWALEKIHRHKDESLARLIHATADRYVRSPERKWD
jgi:hypothetical protein